MNKIAVCSGCSKQIVWLPHFDTKKAAPIDFPTDENGNVIALDEDQDQTILVSAVTYKVLKKGEYAPMPRYSSHFAKCPAAARFRGKK
jgi:hypothetical protein